MVGAGAGGAETSATLKLAHPRQSRDERDAEARARPAAVEASGGTPVVLRWGLPLEQHRAGRTWTPQAWRVPHDDDKDGMATGEQKELTG
jgi:hypothetical protein